MTGTTEMIPCGKHALAPCSVCGNETVRVIDKPTDGDFKEIGEENALAVQPPRDVVLSTQAPQEFIERAVAQADALKSIIDRKGLAINIGGSKKHVLIDGWQTLMALNGVMPYTVSVVRERDPETKKLTAYVVTEIRRVSDGFVLTRVESSCSQNESRWARADDYAIVSMAQTRGVGKGCRQLFGWVMALAGYDATPAEEMPSDGGVVHASATHPPRPVTPIPGDADHREGLTPMDEESKTAIQKRVRQMVANAASDPKEQELMSHWKTWFDARNGPRTWEALWADNRYTYAAITLLGLKREEKPKADVARVVAALSPDQPQERLPQNDVPPEVVAANKIPPATMTMWDKDDQDLVRNTYTGVQKLAKDGTPRAKEALARFTEFMDRNKLNWTGQRGLTNIWTRPELRDEVFRILEITPPAAEEPKGFDPDEVPV